MSEQTENPLSKVDRRRFLKMAAGAVVSAGGVLAIATQDNEPVDQGEFREPFSLLDEVTSNIFEPEVLSKLGLEEMKRVGTNNKKVEVSFPNNPLNGDATILNGYVFVGGLTFGKGKCEVRDELGNSVERDVYGLTGRIDPDKFTGGSPEFTSKLLSKETTNLPMGEEAITYTQLFPGLHVKKDDITYHKASDDRENFIGFDKVIIKGNQGGREMTIELTAFGNLAITAVMPPAVG